MKTEEALSLAQSQLWSDRARAGRHLSAVVGREPVDTVVRSLLLDRANTAVTDATAEELLRRRDAAGLRLIAAVWNVAEPEQGDHLSSCLSVAFFELACAGPEDRTRFRAVLRSLLDDPDPGTRAGARDLLARIARALPD
ncbi:hypothetical protein [Micromonospora arida]|uniref:hypothetical protein n=1 Tax=Micromonospora arida TaxID=2203715 RepID=UPI0033A65B9F